MLTSVSAVSSQTEADLRAQLVAAQEDVISAQTALASALENHVAEVDKLRAQLAVEQELTEQKGAEWQRQLQQAQMENAEALGDVSRKQSDLEALGFIGSNVFIRASFLISSCSSVTTSDGFVPGRKRTSLTVQKGSETCMVVFNANPLRRAKRFKQ